MGIKKLEHVGLMVQDIKRSITFYTEVLGLKHIRTMPHSNGIITLAFLAFPDQEDMTLELIQGYDSHLPVEGKVHHLAFTVSDIEKEFERIQAHPSVQLKDTALTFLPDGSKYFFFYGPDGEFLELFEPGQVTPYPLLFEPQFKERIWGGQTLQQFGLSVPQGAIGEAWMISDHPHGITKVKNGVLAGTPLDTIRTTFGEAWFGKQASNANYDRFPLLIKLLDCNDDLSVQVHPTDEYKYLPQGERGKTEMWYVLSAKPDAKIVYGLKDNTSKEALQAAIQNGTITQYLHEVNVKAGDAFYIPAGTVHALCSGIVVVEIQQNSDTTYRIYDYNRVGLDGKLRELHIEDSLNVINLDNAGVSYIDTSNMKHNEWLTIASSPFFIVEKGLIHNKVNLQTSLDSLEILVIADGVGILQWGEDSIQLEKGQCYLLPATLGDYTIDGTLTILRSYLPF